SNGNKPESRPSLKIEISTRSREGHARCGPRTGLRSRGTRPGIRHSQMGGAAMIHPISGDADDRLETPKQLASRVGSSERQVRYLIETGQLEHVMIGCRVHIPVGAFARFIDARKVMPCQDAIRDRDSVGSPSARASTSPGPN